jgi:arylsulfatase A-like enzyme/Flp pilus assembly protein TadD
MGLTPDALCHGRAGSDSPKDALVIPGTPRPSYNLRIASGSKFCPNTMSYANFLRAPAAVLLSVLILLMDPLHGEGQAKKPEPIRRRSNLLLVTIDTLRPDHLHCYGYEQIQTPSIDSLATQGIRFTQAFTPIPITLPSHTVMLTGTYPMMSGMHDFSGNTLSPTQPTLATVLGGHGYNTGAVIAAAVLDRRFGLNRGFDFYYDHFDFSRLAETNLDLMERPADQVVDQALAWLARPRSKPFFLWVHLYDPHHPYKPPAPFNEKYKSNLYDGEIAYADSQVARLLEYLKQHAWYDHTVIVLAGDHGEGLGEHGEKTHGFFIYNSTLHVPLIIKPAVGTKISAPVVSAQVSLVDLMPTTLGLLNTPVPAQVQGKDVAPMLLQGGDATGSSLYSETYLPRIHFNWSELRGLQLRNFHFISAPKPELYDDSDDPHEMHNLYSDKQAVSGELKSQLTAVVRQKSAGHEMAQKSTLDPILAERLQALGYTALAAGGDDSLVTDAKLADPKDRIHVYEVVNEAIEDSQHGRFSDSIEKLKSVLDTEENSVPIHYLLGLNYYRTKSFADSVTEFTKALKLSPNYMLANFNLGLSNAALGNDDEAIKYLKRTLELDPTNFTAAFDLGVSYLHKNMYSESTEAFRQAVTIYPDFAPGYKALGEMLMFQGKHDEGVRELRTAVRLAPGDPQLHEALAGALRATGNYVEAGQEMRKAQELR